MLKHVVLLLVLLASGSPGAGTASVFEMQVDSPMATVYDRLYKALEEDGFYVVFEVNIGKNLSRFADRWGENYNRNKLDGIRGMVFCNGWYANAVGNLDPNMLSLCPLHVTLIEKDARTTVLFARPTVIAAESPALKVVKRIENDVIAVIRKTLQGE